MVAAPHWKPREALPRLNRGGALADAIRRRAAGRVRDGVPAAGLDRDRTARPRAAALRPAEHGRARRLAEAAPLARGVVGRHRRDARARARVGRLAQSLLPALA